MGDPIITSLADELLGSIEQAYLKARIERLWLGGTAGPSGGQGVRPGGFIGQLIQTLVAYDTTEAATIAGSGSLLDNLNHIRHRILVVSGIASSGTGNSLTVRESDTTPTIVNVNKITFSGAVVTNPSVGEAFVYIPSGGSSLRVREFDLSPIVTNVGTMTFSGLTIADQGNGEALVIGINSDSLNILGLFGLVGWI